MKKNKRFISKAIKRDNGFAAVMAIVSVLIVSLGAAVYLKRAQMFSSFSFTQSTQKLKEHELIAEADSVRKLVIDRLNNTLQVNPSNVTSEAFTSFIATNVVNPYNTDPEQTAQKLKLSLKCLNQIGLKAGSTVDIQQQACTFHRDRMPKSFQLTLERFDPAQSITIKITQEFKIDRATINRFAYIVTASKEDISLGNVTFEGPTGLFFSDEAVARNIIFSGLGSGTIFKDILFTSADSINSLVYDTGAKTEFSRVAFNQPEVFTAALEEIYDKLRNPDADNPLPPGTVLIKPNTAETAYNLCVAGGRLSCSSRTIYSAFEILPSCQVRVVEKSEWTYKTAFGTFVIGGLVNYDTTMAQTAGNIYAVDGTALFHGAVSNAPEAAYKDAVMCEPQTFIAPSFRIGTSIVKQGVNDNIWILSTGDITFQPTGFTWLCSSVNPCTAGVCSPCDSADLKTVLSLKQSSAVNIADSLVSMRLQATMTTSGGSFKIPDSFLDANVENPTVRPKSLGSLETQGLVIASDPTFSSKEWSGSDGVTRIAGFKNISMKPEFSLVEYPPPGLAFAVNIGLVQILTSSSLTKVDVSEAIKSVD